MKDPNDKVGLDKSWLQRRLREEADKLDADYWGNLEESLENLRFLVDTHIAKLNCLLRITRARELRQYGKEREEKE